MAFEMVLLVSLVLPVLPIISTLNTIAYHSSCTVAALDLPEGHAL